MRLKQHQVGEKEKIKVGLGIGKNGNRTKLSKDRGFGNKAKRNKPDTFNEQC